MAKTLSFNTIRRFRWSNASLILFMMLYARPAQAQHGFSIDNIKMAKWDGIGHVYLVRAPNQIESRTAQGKLQFTASFSEYGAISNLDLSNPLEPVVFFADAGTVLTLDNTLSVLGKLNLWNILPFQVNALCRAAQGGFWLLNARGREIVKIDNQGAVQDRNGFPGLGQGAHNPNLWYMAFNHGQLMLLYSGREAWVFDAFANVQGHYQLPDVLAHPFVGENEICGVTDQQEAVCFSLSQKQKARKLKLGDHPLVNADPPPILGMHFHQGRSLWWNQDSLVIQTKH